MSINQIWLIKKQRDIRKVQVELESVENGLYNKRRSMAEIEFKKKAITGVEIEDHQALMIASAQLDWAGELDLRKEQLSHDIECLEARYNKIAIRQKQLSLAIEKTQQELVAERRDRLLTQQKSKDKRLSQTSAERMQRRLHD